MQECGDALEGERSKSSAWPAPFGGRLESPSRANERRALAVFPVEQIAHGLAACFIGFGVHFAVGVAYNTLLRQRLSRLRLAAGRTAVRKTGLVRLELELLRANCTNSNRKSHTDI